MAGCAIAARLLASSTKETIMALREIMELDGSAQPTAATTSRTEPAFGAIITATAAKALAVLRVSLGFAFLWAFLDKTFGLGYATPAERAWINGGSPTKGFLSRVAVGPLEGTFTPSPGPPGRTGCSWSGCSASGSRSSSGSGYGSRPSAAP
jgi:thiosulfate dehydrogenase [quinone] large subunit